MRTRPVYCRPEWRQEYCVFDPAHLEEQKATYHAPDRPAFQRLIKELVISALRNVRQL
jgi:N-acyl-D-aspartate/D-glutamate deacylase